MFIGFIAYVDFSDFSPPEQGSRIRFWGGGTRRPDSHRYDQYRGPTTVTGKFSSLILGLTFSYMKILGNRNLVHCKQKANNKVGFNMSQHFIHMLSQNVSPLYLKSLFLSSPFVDINVCFKCFLQNFVICSPSGLK